MDGQNEPHSVTPRNFQLVGWAPPTLLETALGTAQEQVPQIPRETSLFERLSQCELYILFLPAHLDDSAPQNPDKMPT